MPIKEFETSEHFVIVQSDGTGIVESAWVKSNATIDLEKAR